MKKSLLLLASITFSLNVFAQDKKMAEECFKKADYRCAEEQYSKLVEKEQIRKIQSEYYNNLGTSQRRLGKTSLAFKSYDMALKTNPMSVSVYENLSSLYSQKGDKKKALEYIESGLKVDDKSPDLYLTRSKIYETQDKKDLAKADLNHILTFAPDNIFAKTGLANLKKNHGELEDALKDYNKLIAEKPESLLYNGRADVYLKMKRNKEALADVSKAISIDPKFSQSYVTKAMVLFNTAKPKEACENLDKAVSLGYEKAVLAEYYAKCVKK
ncbi:tetratricopeptide repeat protein [Chryseobacterium indologenes]|uniref:tetratricopeptide repeat protein n=1 Tax=Chryseobacterium TaxID=59732 RepID=UPI0016296122|nr:MULTISPECIES: tetratricopeptide repeat protein [Chryseobacterium]MDM1553483.1 tetratricopeptide repeat protein [Chryseobacterium indologenes]WET49597.1 tetratricopeptide repeat protein [Chryseobacterium indologenes]